MLDEIQWLAVVLAGFAFFLFGALWYGVLFSKSWGRLARVDPEETGGMALTFGATLVLEVIMALVVAIFMQLHEMSGWQWGVHVGLLVGLGLVTPAVVINYLYQRKPAGLMAIDAAHLTLGLVIVGAIVGAWH